MMKVANACGMGILWDAVLNHKCAADYTEKCLAVEVDPLGMRRSNDAGIHDS